MPAIAELGRSIRDVWKLPEKGIAKLIELPPQKRERMLRFANGDITPDDMVWYKNNMTSIYGVRDDIFGPILLLKVMERFKKMTPEEIKEEMQINARMNLGLPAKQS